MLATMELLRRVLGYRISVEALLELGLWLAIPYLMIGVGYTFFNAELVDHWYSQLELVLPAGANLVAFGLTTALWPLLLAAPGIC